MADDSPIVLREGGENPETARNFEKILEAAAPELVKSLTRNKRQELARLLQVTVTSVSIKSGPLPASEELAEYSRLIPDGANRVMAMAEKQQEHRIEIEKKAITSQQRQGERGQIFALIIAILAVGSSVALSLLGHETVAGILGGTTAVTLVVTFITGKWMQRKDLQHKAEGK